MSIQPKNQKKTGGKKTANISTAPVKDNTKDTIKVFPTPKKGKSFILKKQKQQGTVLEINTPSAGFCKATLVGDISFQDLRGLIDQKKGYFTPPKKKYNWDKMKQAYLSSNYEDVTPFLQSKYGLDTVSSGNSRTQTKGWVEEKKKIQEELKAEARAEYKEKAKIKWQEIFEKLDMGHLQGLEDLANMILDQGKTVTRKRIHETKQTDHNGAVIGSLTDIIEYEYIIPYLQQSELINIIKHIKLEKGEPTEILDTKGKSLARAFLDDVNKQKAIKQNEEETTEDDAVDL